MERVGVAPLGTVELILSPERWISYFVIESAWREEFRYKKCLGTTRFDGREDKKAFVITLLGIMELIFLASVGSRDSLYSQEHSCLQAGERRISSYKTLLDYEVRWLHYLIRIEGFCGLPGWVRWGADFFSRGLDLVIHCRECFWRERIR